MNTLQGHMQSIQLPGNPSDGITHVEWSPEQSPLWLSAGSWDKTVRIWKIEERLGNTWAGTPKVCYTLGAPVLSSAFSADCKYLFAAGCDKLLTGFDLLSGNTRGQVMGKHDQPITAVAWSQPLNVVITAGWDGWLKMWDGTSPNPVWQFNAGSKIHAMQVRGQYLGIADANRQLYMWNMTNMDAMPMKAPSPLKMQSRCIGLFIDNNSPGWVVGSVEGRVGVVYCHSGAANKNFCFKAHRQQVDGTTHIYGLNGIDFNGNTPVFVTCGSDRCISPWDRDAKAKLKGLENMPTTVVDVKFNKAGNGLIAYGLSYDWYRGHNIQELQNSVNAVFIHQFTDENLRTRGADPNRAKQR